MTNWEKNQSVINRIVCASLPVPDDIFSWIKKACWDAKKKATKANKMLIGHMKEEYLITEPYIAQSFKEFLGKNALSHRVCQEHLFRIDILSEARPFFLPQLWCNFQKRHEFNPPHDHSGIFSFVIFVQIPYDLKKEEACFPNIVSEEKLWGMTNYTSKFAFFNTNPEGEIRCAPLDVDKSYEGKMIIFPAKQVHMVFPFYTSKNYRITVSGNIKFQV